MRRQPRVDLSKLSYNYEHFRKYTKMYNTASVKDKAKSEKFYKLVKYVKANVENEKDPLVHKFTQVDGFKPELIDIPEEFADLPIDDVTPMSYGRKVQRRKYIK